MAKISEYLIKKLEEKHFAFVISHNNIEEKTRIVLIKKIKITNNTGEFEQTTLPYSFVDQT